MLTAGFYYMYLLFAGIFVSFLLSGVYLFVQIKKMLAVQQSTLDDSDLPVKFFKSFMRYGGPISLWFVFSYSITLIDKYFMLHALGVHEQGNYQALFDLITRSIMLLRSPVIISLFPLVTVAYLSNKTRDIKKFLPQLL